MPRLSVSSLSLSRCDGTPHTNKRGRLVASAMRLLSAFSSRSMAPQRGLAWGNKFYHRLRDDARGMPRSASLRILLIVTLMPLVLYYLDTVALLPYSTVSHFEMPSILLWPQEQQQKKKESCYIHFTERWFPPPPALWVGRGMPWKNTWSRHVWEGS